MSAAKRIKAQAVRKSDPYAWVPGGLLMSEKVCDLSGAGLRLFLLMNANATILPSGQMRTSVPYDRTAALLACGKSTLCGALRELTAAGLIHLTKAGTRPRASGAARGEAAEWDLPFRQTGAHAKLPLRQGFRRLEGALRLNADRIRKDVHELSGPESKILVRAIANHDRTKKGRLASAEPFELRTSETAEMLKLSGGAVNAALKRLVATGRLTRVEPGVGRRPARYKMARYYAEHERWFPATRVALDVCEKHQPSPADERNRAVSVPVANTVAVAFISGTESEAAGGH